MSITDVFATGYSLPVFSRPFLHPLLHVTISPTEVASDSFDAAIAATQSIRDSRLPPTCAAKRDISALHRRVVGVPCLSRLCHLDLNPSFSSH